MAADDETRVPREEPLAFDSLYSTLMEHLREGVYFVDTRRTIKYWNAAAERISGYGRAEVLGKSCSESLEHLDEEACRLCTSECPLSQVLTDRRPRELELFLRHKSGHRVPVLARISPIFDAQGNVIGALETFSEITSQAAVEARVEELQKLVFLDYLTQAGNRRYCEMRLAQAIDEFHRYRRDFGVLLVDIDHFKAINDRHGHHVGDAVLVSTARTLAAGLRSSDVLGRWGGEEFIAILPQISREHLLELGERCRALVAQAAVPTPEGRVGVTVSIGAALVQPDDNVEALVRRADQRLYCSKNNGRNRVTAA